MKNIYKKNFVIFIIKSNRIDQITFIDLTIVMSLGFKVFNADMAASRAGIASASWLSHSSLIPFATFAASFATASSADTT